MAVPPQGSCPRCLTKFASYHRIRYMSKDPQGDCMEPVLAGPSLSRDLVEQTLRKEGSFAPLVVRSLSDAIAAEDPPNTSPRNAGGKHDAVHQLVRRSGWRSVASRAGSQTLFPVISNGLRNLVVGMDSSLRSRAGMNSSLYPCSYGRRWRLLARPTCTTLLSQFAGRHSALTCLSTISVLSIISATQCFSDPTTAVTTYASVFDQHRARC